MNELPNDQQVLDATFNMQLAVGAGMIALCVIIHGLGLFTLQRMLRGEAAEERLRRMEPLSLHGTVFTLMVVFALIFIHFVEIWLFAFLYALVGAQWSFQNALYFSTISYSTVGYNDSSIAHAWRMVGALEGVLGIILLGWSTAFFVRLLGRIEGDGRELRRSAFRRPLGSGRMLDGRVIPARRGVALSRAPFVPAISCRSAWLCPYAQLGTERSQATHAIDT